MTLGAPASPPEVSDDDIFSLGRIRSALGSRASAPAGTGQSPSVTPDGALRQAAVALLLRERTHSSGLAHGEGGSELLLIRRAVHERDPWSGHMALPGGRQDPTDDSLLATVQRETLEEVGVDLARHGELLGRLPVLPAMARGRVLGMTVTPFVFALSKEPELRLNYEVAEVVWATLSTLSSGRVNTTITYEGAQPPVQLPGWDLEGRVVWGLTHRMVSSLLEIVRGPVTLSKGR